MEMFIYFPQPLGIPRDEIEDLLQEYLGQNGEVTGAGAGETGSNVDLEVFGNAHDHVQPIKGLLRQAGVPAGTVIVVEDQRYPVAE